MINALDTVIASLAGSRLTLGSLLKRLRAQARLGPLAREALVRQYILDQAREAGLSITTEELQQAANAYRRRIGLNTAADTHAWLTHHGLSPDDFESGLEEDLLAATFRQQRSAAEVEVYFSSHQADYERLHLGLLVVERDELAQELAIQVRDEGRDLDAVAQEHGLPVIHRQVFRKELAEALAAALASAKDGEMVGPIATPQGFVLVQIKARRESVLDPAIRQAIEQELFEKWLADRTKEATFDFALVGSAG
ncbi:MAG: peptidylprolyl isomerase [Gemmataceae bacterium]